MSERRFTGRHAAMVFVGAFGVIIAVNLVLAFSAVRTFPGLEVANSYVASQQFNTRRDAQEGLGWQAEAMLAEGRILLMLTDAQGQPVQPAQLSGVVGRPTHVQDDFTPEFRFDGHAWGAPADLAPGNWQLRLSAEAADGTRFEQRLDFFVKG